MNTKTQTKDTQKEPQTYTGIGVFGRCDPESGNCHGCDGATWKVWECACTFCHSGHQEEEDNILVPRLNETPGEVLNDGVYHKAVNKHGLGLAIRWGGDDDFDDYELGDGCLV